VKIASHAPKGGRLPMPLASQNELERVFLQTFGQSLRSSSRWARPRDCRPFSRAQSMKEAKGEANAEIFFFFARPM